MTEEESDSLLDIVAELGALQFFPAEPQPRRAIVRMVCEMASSKEQVQWLVNRTIALHKEWPGPRELRAIFCSKFKPRDGIEAGSLVYVDGIPSEHQGPAPGMLALPPGHVASADRQLDEAVKESAEHPADRARVLAVKKEKDRLEAEENLRKYKAERRRRMIERGETPEPDEES
jgi:hypothetical protein